MTIKIIHFEGGYPLDPNKKLSVQRAEAHKAHENEARALPAERYNLTPPGSLDKHSLSVFNNGEGSYLEDSQSRLIVNKTRIRGMIFDEHAEKYVSIPYDAISVAITGPMEDRPGTAIHDIVFYEPGLSPQTRK